MHAMLKTANKSLLVQYKEVERWSHICYVKVVSVGNCSAHMILRAE